VVPTYAASHGCVRVNHYDAVMLFGFAEQGTPVNVFDEAYL
jgi:lipoprotein-anchoring transpeptidase ErfK/SrfK